MGYDRCDTPAIPAQALVIVWLHGGWGTCISYNFYGALARLNKAGQGR